MNKTKKNMMPSPIRIKKNFGFREGKKMLELIKTMSSAGTFAAYLGIRDNRDVNNIKGHQKQIEWVIQNWGHINQEYRILCLNEAIWSGTDFSDKSTLNSFVGEKDIEEKYTPYLVMSGFNNNSKPFAYDIKDEKAMERMIKIANQKNSKVGPIVHIVYSDKAGEKISLEIRNLKSIKKIVDIANSKGKKLKVTLND